MKPKTKPFRFQLKDQRKRLGVTQEATAELLGVNKRSYEAWEGGYTTPIPITQEGALARLSALPTPNKSKP